MRGAQLILPSYTAGWSKCGPWMALINLNRRGEERSGRKKCMERELRVREKKNERKKGNIRE